ncbi:dnaJ homolog subfamily C member 14 [Corythoichthys intestinalis]|uniref:dnaJ homolog subfamily C member 14 n=1 Tax=Corythoichthys intestinalis TaxID=161448 RepID=UPI0025A56E2A|nr:dnaJ homolog subfamily C member 14 [Corythoichthys intestinalis]XP_061814280.1 dnaJ homolog subfamily C member 14-like [Nerophis lumbriciformis]
MEKEADAVTDSDEELSDGDSAPAVKPSRRRTREDDVEHVPDPATGDAEFLGSTEGREETEELSDGLEGESADGHPSSRVTDREEDESATERRVNGDSGWKSFGTGRKCKPRSGGSFSEQSNQSPFSSPSFQKGALASGGRHKQARRRNHHHHQLNRGRKRSGKQLVFAFKEMLSESVSVWCVSCVHMMIEIIVALTHNCGVGVESAGSKLYRSGRRLVGKITDVPGMKADALRILEWTKCAGADAADKAVRSLGWTKRAALSALRLLFASLLFASRRLQSVSVRLGGERGKRYWTAFRDWPFWRRLPFFAERLRKCFGGDGRLARADSPGRAARGPPGRELERLLALAEVPEDELDPFAVLGVEVDATEAELKKAYRQLAVQVHPDKNKHPRAGEAFKVLRAAWDIVSNPETRREYELKRMAATELSKSMNEFLVKLQDDLKEAMNTMMCTKCEGKHKRFEMDREPAEARFCAECGRRHGAEEGDLWAESSMLGLRITYFACMDGKVYDITEWAGCQRIGISPDTHRVPYHISFGSKNNSNAARNRSHSEHGPGPANPADLQDFFNRIFKGAAPGDVPANGGFFPSGPPHHPPPGAGAPPFSPPSGQTGHFTPGSQRPEPGEPWAEGGKPPPRRKKKVRKPFQR